MSRITGVVVALATAATVLTGSTAGAGPGAAAPPMARLPQEIPGGVELTLADGDRLRVWAPEDHRAVWAKRYDTATGAWGARTVVLRKKNLSCGDVDARTANGAVAVIAECDRYGWSEDQAPTSSRALWSADTVTWTSYRLEGEAYEEPGISPDGSRAVWPEFDGYVTFGPEGFTRFALETPGQEYTATTTITDTGQVSYLYGSSRRGCRLVALTRTGDATPTRQVVAFDTGCSDSSFANVDSDTAVFGDLTSPAYVSVVSRPDPSAPWAVSQVAPADAPGLERVERGLLATDFVSSTGLLVALGAPDQVHVRAQVYDPSTQSWGPATTVYDAGPRRCEWAGTWSGVPIDVLVAGLRCGGRHVVLTTPDGLAWQALRSGRHVFGISPDGSYVAVPGRSSTSVISAERGVVTLPLGVSGRCDVVVPDGPDGAVLLTSAGRNGWPTVLRHSSETGWQHLSRTRLPVHDGDCRRAEQAFYTRPYGFSIIGQRRGYGVRVIERAGEWSARRSRF